MDAKILRAAVSAAIKVTMSTALLGCGGSVTRNADGAAADSAGGPTATTGQPSAAESASASASPSYPKLEPVSGGMTGTGGATGAGAATVAGAPNDNGANSSGTSSGGVSSAEGGGAGEASAGSTDAICGGELDACLTLLAQGSTSQPDSTMACCHSVLTNATNGELSYVCLGEIGKLFTQSAGRSVCCNDPLSWQLYPACTPWGPPVPPELSLATLHEWLAAA
ncbi:MAG TPA: hypothetical protein VNG33_07375 [Polyangiaceae bacterium]|nr:hypothetical protein [Polyangiaceae bacterium]